ncbi:DUF742 domain-containing protein [Streptomyces sp. NPDC048277]|uniref:DUF742 domain-containing protein n=1 Tax=Streptomyces sp. NPDC048277 TaxID=3155027 RepID=UPI0033D6DEA1
MSTGEGPSGSGRDQQAEDEQTFADVLNAFSFGTGRRRRKSAGTRGAPQDTTYDDSDEAALPSAPEPNEEPEAPASFVRGYAWTAGRTRSHHHFAVETLVTAAGPGGVPGVGTQWDRAVLDLCREPRSVAEVAALIGVPLGVTKVLLGDMTDRGMIVVHEAATDAGDAPTTALMERVLIGLRQL